MELINLIEKMNSSGYKSTKKRKAILQVLLEHPSTFMNAESILNACRNISSNINMSTVYRNLIIFEKIHLLHKIVPGDGIAKYKIIDFSPHHHHIICQLCGKTDIIEYCPINDLNPLVEDKDFILTDHKLELYGYCKECRNKIK